MKKRFIAVGICVLYACLLAFTTGCFDEGEVEDEEDYCSVLSDVVLITETAVSSYDMDEFYSAEAVNDLISPAPADAYYYFCIRAAETFNGNDLGLHCKYETGKGDSVKIDAFVATSEAFENLKNSSDKKIPATATKVASTSVIFRKDGKWNSFYIKGFGLVNAGDYIIIRFNDVVDGESDCKFTLAAPIVRVESRG